MALKKERCREGSVAVLAHSMTVYFPCLALQLHVMFCVVHQPLKSGLKDEKSIDTNNSPQKKTI